jgi:hypothetical protein
MKRIPASLALLALMVGAARAAPPAAIATQP